MFSGSLKPKSCFVKKKVEVLKGVEDEYLCKEKLVVYVEIQGTSKTLEPWR